MLYYDRIHDSEGDDVNKTSASKECDVCRYQYFLNYSFKFQPNFCNKCYDLLMMSVNRSDIAISNIKGSGYYYQFNQPKKKNNNNTIQDKVSADVKKEFDSESVYNKKSYLKTKMKLQTFTIKKFLSQTLIILVQQ